MKYPSRPRSLVLVACTLFSLAGSLFATPAISATSIYGTISGGTFSGNIQKATTLKEAQDKALATCATTPGAKCEEYAGCSGGGYASIAWGMSPSRMGAACGFSSQAEADAAALAKCGSGCSQGDQLFDSATLAGASCGTAGASNSGCATASAPTASTTPSDEDAANIPRVFNWAEAAFGQFFAPRGQFCQDMAGYRFRFYSQTNSYLAAKNGRVYVLIPMLGNAAFEVGSLAELLVKAKAAGF
ncbi:MAG: hypothetical protein KGZ83_17940 [Sulfuricella sp.]|nr:hypothetical protein [Sulfuricella sp.]